MLSHKNKFNLKKVIKNNRGFIIINHTMHRLEEERAPEAAAGMAYYTFFSLFPLLLLLVAVGSRFLENPESQQDFLETLINIFPFSQTLIRENIEQVMEVRGSIGLVGVIGLAWSATNMFSALARNINRAWQDAESFNAFRLRVVATLLIGLLVGLLGLLLTADVLLRLMSQWSENLWNGSDISLIKQERFISHLFLGFAVFFTLLLFYRWVPNTDVRWREAFWGAFAAAFAFEMTTTLFTWIVGSGLARYNLIYGSLGALVALMIWIYTQNFIVIIGAHFCASIAQLSRFE